MYCITASYQERFRSESETLELLKLEGSQNVLGPMQGDETLIGRARGSGEVHDAVLTPHSIQ